MRMNKLVLFDVDYTLVSGLKGHKRAFREALKRVYGVDADIDIINHQGMVDKQTIIEVLLKKNFKRAEILQKIEKCTKEMEALFKDIIKDDEITLLPGVRELLKELSKQNIQMGLVTGNLEVIAREKLDKVGINSYFKFGGFGSDGFKRTTLVKIAVKRAEKIFDCKFSNIFLFGDTPRDIIAGREGGVVVGGVATGNYSKEELKKAGADFVLESFKEKERFFKIIGGKR